MLVLRGQACIYDTKMQTMKVDLQRPAPVDVWRSSCVTGLAHDLVLGECAGSQMTESGMQRQKEEL